MELTVIYDSPPKQPSSHAAVVMDHFGIGLETGPKVIAENLQLPVEAGDVVCFTGPSGSGKSSLLRAAAEALRNSGDCVVDVDALDPGERMLIDALELPVREGMHLLSACGLGEAPLLLRWPDELSTGERYRFRLALALAGEADWILADEFAAALDRKLARVVAFNLRRLASRTGRGFLLATACDDVLEDLQPSLEVRCALDGKITWQRNEVKKKASASRRSYGSARRPDPTGRTSLGGIIAAGNSA